MLGDSSMLEQTPHPISMGTDPVLRISKLCGQIAPCFQGQPTTASQPRTVFDHLFDAYLPFRLYAEFMMGSSFKDLSRTFGLSEQWVEERVEAMRLCLSKQVRLTLLSRYYEPRPLHARRLRG